MYGAQLLEKLAVDAAALDAKPHLASSAQIEAGNYPKGHARVGGLDVSIENPAGSVRSGIGANGKPWMVTMRDHYGYVRRSTGRDGEHVDVFVVPGTPEDWTGPVYVIDQKDVETGGFDEHKVVLGAATEIQARRVYARNYSMDHNGLQAIHEISLDQFKQWLADGDTTIPFASHVPLGKALLEILRKENECHDPETGQFCEGAGPKEKHPGGVKGHVHELLATGKPFTIAELAQATGATHERVKFLLSRLQSPKYAAKAKDALIIQREGNQYRVVGTKPALTSEEKAAFKTAKTEQAPIGTNEISAKSFDESNPNRFTVNNAKVNDLIESGSAVKTISHGEASSLKGEVSARLGAMLEDNEHWQKVVEVSGANKTLSETPAGKMIGETGSVRLVSRIIGGWAATSADQDARAKAMQLAARDEFNIKDAALGHMGIHSKEDEEKVWNSAARQFGFNYINEPQTYGTVSPQDLETFKSAMRAFTRAEYENTQAWFKEKGITEVSLFRGTKQSVTGDPVVTKLHGQPLSSFSSRQQTAQYFGKRVYMATFPVSHVVGSCRTGRGCLSEREVVVLGHPIKVVRTSRDALYHRSVNEIGRKAFGGKMVPIHYGGQHEPSFVSD